MVANCKAAVGAWVTVTVVNPDKVVEVPPNAIVVLPIVMELFCNDVFGMFDNDSAFDPPNETDADPLIPPEYVKLIDELVSDPLPMLDNVLLLPSIVLLVSACTPVSVATVESILIVFAADPSNVVPLFNCRPVPTVNALVVVAVIVPEAPSATATPLYVTDELVRLELPISDSVLLFPLIVLLVRICTASSVTTGTELTVAATMSNVPPVTVLPVNVIFVGSDSTTLVVPTASISSAVPVTEATAPIAAGSIATSVAEVICPCAFTTICGTAAAVP